MRFAGWRFGALPRAGNRSEPGEKGQKGSERRFLLKRRDPYSYPVSRKALNASEALLLVKGVTLVLRSSCAREIITCSIVLSSEGHLQRSVVLASLSWKQINYAVSKVWDQVWPVAAAGYGNPSRQHRTQSHEILLGFRQTW